MFIIDFFKKHLWREQEREQEIKIDFVDKFPKELILEIFSNLNNNDLQQCLLVNKKWNDFSNDYSLWKAKIAFGKKQWEAYFGDVGKEPPLPKEMREILEKKCPFWTEIKVKNTHMLVLIPKTINGKSFNLKTLLELVKTPQGCGHKTECHSSIDWEQLKKENPLFEQPIPSSYWLLMPRKVIPNSRGKSYQAQQTLITKINKEKETDYEVANLLAIVTGICTEHVRSGRHLFHSAKENKQPTYTRCQEKRRSGQITVGNFSSQGLTVGSVYDHERVGIAPVRKFSEDIEV